MKKILTIAAISLSLTGCIHVVNHVDTAPIKYTYEATRFVGADCVGVWWNDAYCRKYPIETAWIKFTWLLWVVDLPCEVVMDTLTFPYDYIVSERYWDYIEKKKQQEGKSRFAVSMEPQYELKDANYSISHRTEE